MDPNPKTTLLNINIFPIFGGKTVEDVSGTFLSTIVSSMAVPPHLRGHIPYKHKKNMWDLALRIQIESHSNPDHGFFLVDQVNRFSMTKTVLSNIEMPKFSLIFFYICLDSSSWSAAGKMLDPDPQ
jgi:hypothetical protein